MKSDTFTCVRVEGSILPTDLLQRVAAGDPRLAGLRAEDYGLVGEKVNEAANHAWTRLSATWETFKTAKDKLPENDPGQKLTVERWLMPFWKVLGYGTLDKAKPFVLDEKTYPISHIRYHSPVHLVGFRHDLDKRVETQGKHFSPHGLVQEFLNRSEDHLWGFVSNGLKLRILRDNIRLTRQAFLEFDLQAMFDGKQYADFALLWKLCHESRVNAEKPEECWLERWSKVAAEQGLRALDQLRTGVENAIKALGRGFLSCPANAELKAALKNNRLAPQGYYRQLLRVVYRFLFLFVAEDRELLFDPAASESAKDRYSRFYATARLRRVAERLRGSPHTDLYEGLSLVLEKLGTTGCLDLALPALGGLFDPARTPNLSGCRITNADLLEAVRAVAVITDGQSRRSVDYRNLGAEELGSVYESLLELHPQFDPDAITFTLQSASGNERKTSGSYYTPTSLITCLLDSALHPVLDEAASKPNPEAAILGLKVCDPACGSGHFLIAAAHRIAKKLAGVRTLEEEPPPDAIQHALRDVIGRCIFGVDINPMAVELCQVALWMDALEPGKPLSFLEHHLQCGNSLLGTTPALLARGIPDEAFEPIEGDEKPVCQERRRLNRQQREDREHGQGYLFSEAQGLILTALAAIEETPDDTLEQIHAKEERFRQLVGETNYRNSGHLLADLWCAAFVVPKRADYRVILTDSLFRSVEQNPEAISLEEYAVVRRLAEEYRLFHWHMAFPGVFRLPSRGTPPDNESTGWCGGFDVVLGNPPWDTLSPDAKEFFSAYDPGIRATDKAGQRRIVQSLLEQPEVAATWERSRRENYAWVHFIKDSGRYQLFAPGNLGKGDFNVFRMFVETALQHVRPGGWASQIVPEGLYNGANSTAIRRHLFEHCELPLIFGFANLDRVWFPDIYYRMKFCIYSAKLGGNTTAFRTAFNIRTPERLAEVQRGQALVMPVTVVKEFSPDALAVMELGNQMDIDIAAKLYRWPKFGDMSAGPPRRVYMREIDMGNDRDLFTEDPTGYPVYEGRMVAAFDHRAKGYRSGRGRSAEWADLPFSLATKSIQPQWYIPIERVPEKVEGRMNEYRVAFCDVASPTNERTLVAALVPLKTLCGHSAPTIVFRSVEEWYYPLWVAVANSFALDFISRMKVSLHMTFTILDSLPFPRLTADDPRVRQLVPIAIRLSCTGAEMAEFWNTMATQGWVEPIVDGELPPGIMDEEERLAAMAEIDVIVARNIFGLTPQEMEHVLDTFPIIRKNDEAKYGGYRTKETILRLYREFAAPRLTQSQYDMLKAMTCVAAFVLAWKKRVETGILETGLVLMVNDPLRKAYLTNMALPGRQVGRRHPKLLDWMPLAIDQLLKTNAIKIDPNSPEGLPFYLPGPSPFDLTNLGAYVQKALEAVKVIKQIGEQKARTEVEENVDDPTQLIPV